MQPYPQWICAECGKRYGRGMARNHVATWHDGKCDICDRSRPVTEPRDFGHLLAWPVKESA